MRGNAKFPAVSGLLLLTGLAVLIAGAGLFAQHPSNASLPAPNQDSVQADNPRQDSPFDRTPSNRDERDNPLMAKQRASILHSNLEKSKKDAIELASLAKALREELDKPGANSASPGVSEQADKIERLAKKIRDETMAY